MKSGVDLLSAPLFSGRIAVTGIDVVLVSILLPSKIFRSLTQVFLILILNSYKPTGKDQIKLPQ